MLNLSIAEQKLINFAHEEFGEFLAHFLLAGLGAEDAKQGWQFTITYTEDEGVTLERRVYVLSYEPEDGQSYLPRNWDPLILLALLKLLTLSNQAAGNNLRYNQESVLNLLGWKDSQQARGKINEALNRYSLLLFKWDMNRIELARNNLSHCKAMECLITKYEIVDEEEGRTKPALNHVVFNPSFISQLRHRSLFEIDWDKAQSLKPDLANVFLEGLTG